MKKLLALLSFLVSGFISYVAADVTAPSGRFLQIRDTLQPSSTVYFSSGTVQTYLSANGIMSLPHSATPPPTDCDAENERGRVYIDTNAVSGRQFYACEGTLGWILQGDGGSGGGSGTTILVKDGGSSIVNTSTLNFTGATFVVTNSGGEGLVAIDFSSVPSRSDVILNQNSLQTGSTFYVSSGTVSGQFAVSSIKFADGTIQVSSPVAAGGTSPAGSNGNVQFNNSGSFGGVSNFNFDRSSNTLSVVGTLIAADLKDGVLIISTSPASSSPGSGLAWNYPNFTGSTQTVFRIIPSQSASDTSTSTLVGFYVRGDNLLEEVMRIGEPSGSTVPHVVFPATGTRIQLTAGSFGTAYIEANSTSGDLVISPTSSANRIRLGDGAVGTVLLLFDTASNDGNLTWDGSADAFQVSDDVQLQAQNEARFADSDSSNYVGFKAAGTIGTNRIWELPSADGTSGQAITTNGSGVLSFTTISGGGGGGASVLEVFSNFDGTRSSPTASISIGDTLKLSVTGSTAVINVDPANVILSTNSLQSGATFYVSSGTVAGNISVGSATVAGWSVNGVDNDYLQITPRSSGIRLKIDRSNAEINIGNTASASPVVFTSQNSAGIGTISYTGPTNGYSVNSHVGLASGKALRLYDTIDSNYVALKASSTLSQTNTYVLPSTSGSADQAVTTDGSNNLRFQTVIVSTSGLQSGTTFYTSSGTAVSFNSTNGNIVNLLSTNTTVTNLNATNATINTSLTTNMFANFGSPYLVPYLDASNKFTTSPNFLFADFANILYGPSILATTEMGAYNGASIVAYDNDSSHFVKLKSSASLTNSNTYVLPASSGTAGQAILTDGANNLYFGSAGMSPGATYYIRNTDSLQTGSTFYVQRGFVNGDMNVNGVLTVSTQIYISDGNIDISELGTAAHWRINNFGATNAIGNAFYEFGQTVPNMYWFFDSGSTGFGGPQERNAGVVFKDETGTSATNNIGALFAIEKEDEKRVIVFQGPLAMYTTNQVQWFDSDSSNYVGFKASNTVSSNITWVLPTSAGSANSAMVTDGSSNLSFQPVVLSTNSLQSGATFYVSSGTVQGDFTVITSSNGRSNSSVAYTTFADDFFDSKYLYEKKYIPSNDGSYGGLGYYLYASPRTENVYRSGDPAFVLGPNTGGNGSASMSAGSASVIVSSSFASILLYSQYDGIAMDNTNRMSLNSSTVTVYGSNLQTLVNTPGAIRFRENTDSDGVILKGRSSMSGDLILNLPSVGASTNTVLKINSVSGSEYNLEFGDIRRSMKFSQVFNAEQAKLPGSNPCVISNSTAATIPSLLCDASTDESASWSTILTEYTTTTMRADIYYTMVSTQAPGVVVHNIQVMCASTTYSADLDTESFGSVNASTITVPSSIGRVGVASVTVTAGDGCQTNDLLVLKYTRDANASADTAPGDIEIRKIWLYEP